LPLLGQATSDPISHSPCEQIQPAFAFHHRKMFDHGESIYNIIPPEQVEEKRGIRYTSKHDPSIPPSSTTFGLSQTSNPIAANISGTAEGKVVAKKQCRTMGRKPGTNRNDPMDYMKKHAKTGGKVETLEEVKRNAPEKLVPSELQPKLKPDVPKASDTPVMNLVTSKNFIVSNAVETILAAPKKVQEGSKDYLNKEDYGKVPKYLKQIRKDIDEEYEYIRQLQDQNDHNDSQMRLLPEEERQKLVTGLKARWEQINTEYQGATHITNLDTHGKVKRKEKWEAELSQIEKDIERLSRRNILVSS